MKKQDQKSNVIGCISTKPIKVDTFGEEKQLVGEIVVILPEVVLPKVVAVQYKNAIKSIFRELTNPRKYLW